MERTGKEGLTFFQHVRAKMSKESYFEFLNHFYSYTREKIGKSDLEHAVTAMIGQYPDLLADFFRFLNICENLSSGLSRNNTAEEKKKLAFEESGTDDCSRNPSYRWPPCKDNGSNRTGHESGVLSSDCCVSVPPREGNNRSRKKIRIDQHQEVINKRDDDRDEVDTLMLWLRSAVKYAKILSSSNAKAEEGFSRTHFISCVEHMYGNEASVILEFCEKKDPCAVGAVLVRLNQKIQELTEFKAQMQKIWISI
ncbi:conserved hypothetical protein [Ricinus communis]|uniref:Histone deacetylase interacting domain-containing protein n=1 Tax=Ricinus communis TaxID=3988 RepID=B9S359_RICCO|nr:conserved hypothetical protein [Ricinus communis]